MFGKNPLMFSLQKLATCVPPFDRAHFVCFSYALLLNGAGAGVYCLAWQECEVSTMNEEIARRTAMREELRENWPLDSNRPQPTPARFNSKT